MHKEPDLVYRDKCGQCAEAQMVQPQWRCRATFDGCEWLISGLAGSDRVTSGGAWQRQAHTRAFPPETRWSRNLQDAQQLLSHPHRSPIYSGYLLPLELDRFLLPASSFDGKAAESNGSFHVSQRAALNPKHAYFYFSSLHPFILSSGSTQPWNYRQRADYQKQSKHLAQALHIHFISIRLFLCHFALFLKCCNLPCVKILSDSCNGIWVSSRGWRFSALALCCDQFRWAHRAGGHRDREDVFAPEWS